MRSQKSPMVREVAPKSTAGVFLYWFLIFHCFSFLEKGFNLLYYLEKHLGGAAVFEPYVKAHVQEFAGRSINTDDWKTFLYSFMEKTYGQEKVDLLNKVDWEAWLAGTGMVGSGRLFTFD